MTYKAHIGKLKNIQPIENADRLNKALFFGNMVVVSKEYDENTLYLYFPSDGQLSLEYAEANNLLRKKDEEGNNVGGYLDPDKRNIRAIRLRGTPSDGLVMPLSSLESFGDYSKLRNGDSFSVFNGHSICQKYIPKAPPIKVSNDKKQLITSEYFREHVDTKQLAYHMQFFDMYPKAIMEITLKLHGTSQRTGYLPVKKKGFLNRLFNREEYAYLHGTRRTVIESFGAGKGFYSDNTFRKAHAEQFVGKLKKGETVYYEIVGYLWEDSPIMSEVSNKKLQDKEFEKQYGAKTVFHYGCENGHSKTYVYRMNYTTLDGEVFEYPYDLMAQRCQEIGVEVVPLLDRFIYTNQEDLTERVNLLKDGVDPIGKTHIREGVVVRVATSPRFEVYKDKNFSFKVLEGVAKLEAKEPDMEEADV